MFKRYLIDDLPMWKLRIVTETLAEFGLQPVVNFDKMIVAAESEALLTLAVNTASQNAGLRRHLSRRELV